MRHSKLPRIAMGCLLKPLPTSAGAAPRLAGFDARIVSGSTYTFSTRPRGRSQMEGVVDGHAQFDASRYRCH